MESDGHIDIRGRVRAHALRQVTIARLAAPDDWQDMLRSSIAENLASSKSWERGGNARLFVESFLFFFTATMIFLA